MRDDLFDLTYFTHRDARFKADAKVSLQELAEKIDTEVAETKELLPWVKLAVFGEFKSAKGSLRHDDNVRHITGCEADYDQGKMSFDEAATKLRAANIECILHTSPSHRPDNPRWRVLAPTSKPLPKEQRAGLVARINGVLGGIVAAESFVVSQSYYHGHLEGAGEYRVELIEGRHIDLASDLDAGAIGKSGHKDDGNGHDYERADLTELTRRILSGESLHPSVGPIAGSYAARKIPIEACLDYIGLAFTAAHQPRYGGRWDDDVVRYVRWVYAEEARKTVTPPPAAPSIWIRGDVLTSTPSTPQEWSVRDLIPARQVCLFSGHGAVGKSSTALNLVAAHVLGRAWLRYDPRPGPAFFIDAEDDTDVIHRRLDAILSHYEEGSPSLEDLHILSLAGKGAVMATTNRNGIVEPTPLYHELYQRAGDIKPQQIVIASSANVFAGSEMDRSQVTQFIDLLTKIAILTNGSVILISHPSLTGLNTNSGISGSTQWHNAVRARIFMKFVTNGGDEQDNSDLRVLEFMKNQYGPPAQSLTLKFINGLFLVETDGVSNLDRLAREEKATHKFRTLLARMLDQNRPVSAKPTARNYAPKSFESEPDADGLKKFDFENAMKRLFVDKIITVKQYGEPRKGWERIEFV